MLQQLKMERDSFEKEKIERKDIVNMLEARLRQMTTVTLWTSIIRYFICTYKRRLDPGPCVGLTPI